MDSPIKTLFIPFPTEPSLINHTRKGSFELALNKKLSTNYGSIPLKFCFAKYTNSLTKEYREAAYHI